jgi:hypothetical protein
MTIDGAELYEGWNNLFLCKVLLGRTRIGLQSVCPFFRFP